MKAIVAVYHTKDADEWGIGANGTQPLTLSVDRTFFRQITKGHPVIVGYNTLLDFPNQKPLPHRRNIVLTRKNIQIDGAEVVHNIQNIPTNLEDAFVIGGASIYIQLLPFCDEVYITHIYKDINADTFFPNLYKDESWEIETLEMGHENGIEFKIEKLKRRDKVK